MERNNSLIQKVVLRMKASLLKKFISHLELHFLPRPVGHSFLTVKVGSFLLCIDALMMPISIGNDYNQVTK